MAKIQCLLSDEFVPGPRLNVSHVIRLSTQLDSWKGMLRALFSGWKASEQVKPVKEGGGTRTHAKQLTASEGSGELVITPSRIHASSWRTWDVIQDP